MSAAAVLRRRMPFIYEVLVDFEVFLLGRNVSEGHCQQLRVCRLLVACRLGVYHHDDILVFYTV